ncbi:lytic transglycosylase domain-containing protein [Agaricicola taiwanensis]|nr:lytic transglycosylase domain-containing protein [Agaricicola taiwanensis]
MMEAARAEKTKPRAARTKARQRTETAKAAKPSRQAKAEKSAPVVEGRAAAVDIPQTRVEKSTRGTVRASAPAGSESLRAMVARHAAANGVPYNLAHGVIMVESRYNARATGPGGYIGLMQLSYRTAKGMGYSGTRAGLYDPDTNLRYGMKYLGGALRLAGGSTCGAVSKYQGGHGVKGVTRAGSVYCAKVRKHIAAMPAAPKSEQVAANTPRS